jgi:hypothetical protein
VGGLAAAAAAATGAGGCAGSVGSATGTTPDAVCYDLVKVLAERVGLVTAAFTAVVVLTTVGLSRTAVDRGTLEE